MTRTPSNSVNARNAVILEAIKNLKSEHPFWGYRRVWAYLKFGLGLDLNKKRILRLMRQNGLTVKPDTRLKATRTPRRNKPKPDHPDQWWGIDMTKVMVEGFGWIYIVVVLDWFTKKVVGHYAGLQCRAKHWLEALEMAVNNQLRKGARCHNLNLMSDNGCQPTSIAFMQACSVLDINQAFTSYNNPKGNADTERFFRTLKEELLWLREWTSPFELINDLGGWIEYYNADYLHSALGYRSPARFEEEYLNSQLLHISEPC